MILNLLARLIGEKYPAYNSVIPLENENLTYCKKNRTFICNKKNDAYFQHQIQSKLSFQLRIIL